MALLCIDASLVVAWLVPSERSDLVADTWRAYAHGEDEFVSPSLLYAETLSVIRRLASRGALSTGEAAEIVDEFLALSIPTPSPPGLYWRAYQLATRYGQPRVYDSCYLALAESLSCPLLTLDQRLHNAVGGDLPWVRLVR